jgi:hypothetical protein
MAGDRRPVGPRRASRPPVASGLERALCRFGLLFAVAATSAHAQPAAAPPVAGKPAAKTAPATPPLAWYDVGLRRPLTPEPALQADFSVPASGSDRVLKAAGTASRAADARVSPVFRDETGRRRALPGGVLVVLRAPADEAGGRAALAAAGAPEAATARRLTPTLWRVDAPAGIASLELANRLHASGRFVSAQPDWWVERALK